MTVTCFLTLDGVLHPAGSYVDSTGKARVLRMGSEPFEWAQRIAVADRRSELEFVICSPWLQLMSLQQLREQAPPWMRECIVGACEQFAELDEMQHVHRHTALWTVVDNYVQKHGIKHWLAVDCTGDGWPADSDTHRRLVVCDPKSGLGDPRALTNFAEAVLRESELAGTHYSATFVLSLNDEFPLATQERWHVDFWLPDTNDASPVQALLLDELTRHPCRKVTLDGRRNQEDLTSTAFRALCAARFMATAKATDWRPTYLWNRIRFVVETVPQLPIGRTLLQLVIEIWETEYRVSSRLEDGRVESYWQSLTEEDGAPLNLLGRAVTTALDAERRLPC